MEVNHSYGRNRPRGVEDMGVGDMSVENKYCYHSRPLRSIVQAKGPAAIHTFGGRGSPVA